MNFTYLAMAFAAIGCTPTPAPPAAAAKPGPPVVINRTIIRTQSDTPEGVPPGSKAAAVVKEFRIQEKAARDARGYPGATKDQLRDINETEHNAHDATQKLINQDGHSTQQDQDNAHGAIDALRKAQQAPRLENPPPALPEQ